MLLYKTSLCRVWPAANLGIFFFLNGLEATVNKKYYMNTGFRQFRIKVHVDLRTNVYYCLMGPKGQHKGLKTSLTYKSTHFVTFLAEFVYFTRLHSHMKTRY